MEQNQRMKSVAQQMLEGPQFELLSQLQKQLQNEWQEKKKRGENEFETIWNVASSEGRVEGLQILFRKLEDIAHSEI